MASNKMRPIHPGEILREEYLAPLGMSANALAMALHVPAPRIPRFSFEQLAAQEMAMSAQQPRLLRHDGAVLAQPAKLV